MSVEGRGSTKGNVCPLATRRTQRRVPRVVLAGRYAGELQSEQYNRRQPRMRTRKRGPLAIFAAVHGPCRIPPIGSSHLLPKSRHTAVSPADSKEYGPNDGAGRAAGLRREWIRRTIAARVGHIARCARSRARRFGVSDRSRLRRLTYARRAMGPERDRGTGLDATRVGHGCH